MKSFTGIVQKGSQRARLLGYPTINLELDDPSISGIFAATVQHNDEEFLAVAFADPSREVLEAHILDYDEDLYGKSATIDLLSKIRERASFESDEALKEAIARDVAAVREYFGL